MCEKKNEFATDSIDVEIETNVIGEEEVAVMAAAALDAAGVSRRNRSRDDGVVVADTDADVDNALPGNHTQPHLHLHADFLFFFFFLNARAFFPRFQSRSLDGANSFGVALIAF